jgi:hypothetical protein
MKSKEFDQLVRRSFEDASLPYNPENWQKLSANLDQKEQRRRRFVLWPTAAVAASVAMAIGIFLFVNRANDTKVVHAKKDLPAGTQQIAVQEPVVSSNTIIVEEPVNTPALRKSTQGAIQLPAPQRTSAPIVVKQQPEDIQNRIAPQQVVPVMPESPVIVNNVQPEPTLHRAEKNPAIAEVKKPVRSLAAITNPNTYYEDVVPIRKDRKQYVTMAGGLNYGTLNSGYVMGFSAGTKLNGKFYVESDVAFVGNIANEKNQKTTFTPKASNPYAKTTSAASAYASTVTVQRFYNLYYAQVTPTLGYKVAPKLSVGVGADMQRLLINQVLITETDNPADSKELPVYDMGLVGKTEYSLTREIKASVYYRKGVNQAILGNGKMLDRDYLQLQLKFNILNR